MWAEQSMCRWRYAICSDSTLMKAYTISLSGSASPNTFTEDMNDEDPPFCCTDGPLASRKEDPRLTIIRCVLSRKHMSHSLAGLITLPMWPLMAARLHEADHSVCRSFPANGRLHASPLTY